MFLLNAVAWPMQAVTGNKITWIARVTLPLFFVMCVMALLLWCFSQVATWLPSKM